MYVYNIKLNLLYVLKEALRECELFKQFYNLSNVPNTAVLTHPHTVGQPTRHDRFLLEDETYQLTHVSHN